MIRSPRSSSGPAGDRGLDTLGVLEQRDLDLAGADLVAAGLDQVGRAAADDADVAVAGAVARSPVKNQPSRIASAVASGRLR